MAKMCWKCGKYHEDGAKVCPYCGAAFTSDDERYQQDGRTISDKDEDAYLAAPPPKYRRNHAVLPVLIIAALIVGMVFVVAQDFNRSDVYDVRYNYAYGTAGIIETDSGSILPEDGMQFVILHIRFYNDDVNEGVSNGTGTWNFKVICNGNTYPIDKATYSYVMYHDEIKVAIGYQGHQYEVFQIPKGYDYRIEPHYEGPGNAVIDRSIIAR